LTEERLRQIDRWKESLPLHGENAQPDGSAPLKIQPDGSYYGVTHKSNNPASKLLAAPLTGVRNFLNQKSSRGPSKGRKLVGGLLNQAKTAFGAAAKNLSSHKGKPQNVE
jgi:hypothetical protein